MSNIPGREDSGVPHYFRVGSGQREGPSQRADEEEYRNCEGEWIQGKCYFNEGFCGMLVLWHASGLQA